MQDTKPVHFLLVEDDEEHAMLVKMAFSESDISGTLDWVTDGTDALEYLYRQEKYASSPRPDVILLDLRLPKMDGHEVLTTIKADPKLKHIPVIVLSTSDSQNDRERAYQLAANSYLVKPIDFENFQQLISELKTYWGFWNQPPP